MSRRASAAGPRAARLVLPCRGARGPCATPIVLVSARSRQPLSFYERTGSRVWSQMEQKWSVEVAKLCGSQALKAGHNSLQLLWPSYICPFQVCDRTVVQT
mmetsp:Transcript_12165/g.19246  ORF Transcript_12165/g.19246 Transcript_12165/m.19246 type:complete len:101 (-) Transcript_12165:213-515(-)